jgi:hypothetical protein
MQTVTPELPEEPLLSLKQTAEGFGKELKIMPEKLTVFLIRRRYF